MTSSPRRATPDSSRWTSWLSSASSPHAGRDIVAVSSRPRQVPHQPGLPTIACSGLAHLIRHHGLGSKRPGHVGEPHLFWSPSGARGTTLANSVSVQLSHPADACCTATATDGFGQLRPFQCAPTRCCWTLGRRRKAGEGDSSTQPRVFMAVAAAIPLNPPSDHRDHGRHLRHLHAYRGGPDARRSP